MAMPPARGARLISGVVAALVGALSAALPAVGQRPSPTYENTTCKFSIPNPQAWPGRRLSGGNFVLQRETPYSIGAGAIIGPIKVYTISAGSAETLAQATAAQFCLNCLRNNLVWIDRFTQASTYVIYTISSEPDKQWGHTTPYYWVTAFLFAPTSSSQDANAKAFVRADLVFFVPQSDYRKMEMTIMDMIRGFHFQQSDCWS